MLEIGMVIKNERNIDVCYKVVDVHNNRTSATVKLMPYNMGQDGTSFMIGLNLVVSTEFDYEKLKTWRYAKDNKARSFRNVDWLHFT